MAIRLKIHSCMAVTSYSPRSSSVPVNKALATILEQHCENLNLKVLPTDDAWFCSKNEGNYKYNQDSNNDFTGRASGLYLHDRYWKNL